MLTLTWARPMLGWYALTDLDLSFIRSHGVYLIWHEGQPGRVVKVGQGDIKSRLGCHRIDPAVLAYRRYGTLRTTWAVVPAPHLDGVERFLGDSWCPLVGDRFPEVEKIAVNSPF